MTDDREDHLFIIIACRLDLMMTMLMTMMMITDFKGSNGRNRA